MTVSVTRSVRFSAAMRSGSQFLGHDYRVDVTLAGEPDPVTQMFVNLAELDATLRELVVAPLQGTLLDEALPGAPVSCESLTLHLVERLRSRLPRLTRLRVHESPDLFVEWQA